MGNLKGCYLEYKRIACIIGNISSIIYQPLPKISLHYHKFECSGQYVLYTDWNECYLSYLTLDTTVANSLKNKKLVPI